MNEYITIFQKTKSTGTLLKCSNINILYNKFFQPIKYESSGEFWNWVKTIFWVMISI